MSGVTTRRSTRRTAASAEPAQSALEHVQPEVPAPDTVSKKRGRKPKASAVAPPVQLESQAQTVTASRAVTKVTTTSRANSTVATKTTSTSTTTQQATPAPARRTRAARANAEAVGAASPQRSLDEIKVKRSSRKRNASETRESVPEPAESAAANDEDDDEQGRFFSKSEHNNISSIPRTPPVDNEKFALREENFQLRDYITELEAYNARLDILYQESGVQIDRLETDNEKLKRKNEDLKSDNQRIVILMGRLADQSELLRHQLSVHNIPFPDVSQSVSHHSSSPVYQPRTEYFPEHLSHHLIQSPTDRFANHYHSEFDSDLMHADTSPAQPVFVNGSESALALLHKIEDAAKQSTRADSSMHESETVPDHNVTANQSPQQPPKRSHAEVSATPERPAPTPSIFSRSFSAIKSRLFSSTPKAPATPQVATPTPPKPLPPQDTITETLSLPPTPVGERVRTPSKRKPATNTMLRVLLRGIDAGDQRKAEAWAKQVIPELKNDPDFREKRKRLEAIVLFKDLDHFPSSKPWETGFGDPLGDLDDDDVVPGWAVYMNMMAEEEEHKAKKSKKSGMAMGDEEVPTIDEQYAASNSVRTSPKLYNSRGHSASLYDFQPRRSIDPSPMFATPVSHHDGDNIFNELQKHDTAVEARASDREISQNTPKKPKETEESVHHHNPNMGSFSVPDDSDEDDSTMLSETAETEPAPLWTQPPPPAPVPAHAPLPAADASVTEPAAEPVAESATDAPATTSSQQPVDEIERQRQRLMKHTPAKPSRLREATYPSPSLFSDAGNESILAATPIHMTPSTSSMFADIPGAETIELDDECQAAFDELVNSDTYKQQIAATNWPAPTLTYESDEEDLSPV